LILLICIVGMGVLVAPMLALDVALSQGLMRPMLIGAPSKCPELIKAVKRMPRDRQLLLPQVLAAANQKKIDVPSFIIGKVLFEDPVNRSANIQQCLNLLIPEFPNSTSQLLDFLNSKHGSLSSARATSGGLYYPVVEGCKKNSGCAKELEMYYSNSKNPTDREALRRFMGDVGATVSLALISALSMTDHLGFGPTDTPAPLQTEVHALIETAIKDKSRKTAWLLFIQDKKQKPVLRWRVMRLMRANGLLNEDVWPLLSELVLVPQLPIEEQWDFFGSEAKNWPHMPDVINRVALQVDAFARQPRTAGEESVQKVTAVLNMVSGFKKSTSIPAQPEMLKEPRGQLTIAINNLMIKLIEVYPPNHPVWNSVIQSFSDQVVMTYPLMVTQRLLLQPQSMDLGLRLLLVDPNTQGPSQALFVSTVAQNRGAARTAFIKSMTQVASRDENAALKLVTMASSLGPADRALILKHLQAAQEKLIPELESRILDPKIQPLDQVHHLIALLSFQPHSRHGQKLLEVIEQKFTCDERWTRTLGNVVSAGPDHVGFLPATFKLLSCPAEKVDANLMRPILTNPAARRKIQAFTKLNKALTQAQLTRLTELYGMANRIPGSTLPPKVNRLAPSGR
jgi:hypothetical protein